MYKMNDLVEDLNTLLSLDVADHPSLSRWYDRAEVVVKNIRSSPELSNMLSEDVWHYLSDADIRLKDASFKHIQEQKLRNFIEKYYS